MTPYLAILSARFRALLQYRAAAIAGFGTQVFWGFIRVMIFTAFYQSTTAVMPMSLEETVSYIWLGQALLLLVPWNTDQDVAGLIRSGNVVYELARPVDLYWLWYARAVALRTAPALLRFLPLFLIAVPFLGLQLPASPMSAIAFLAALPGAIALSAAMTTLIGLSMLWTISGDGGRMLMAAMVMIFSGITVPLPLFPAWMQPLLDFLPFRGIMDVPFRLYLGHIPPEAVWKHLLHQFAWVAALIITGRMMLSRATRRLVVQGG